MDYHYSWVAIMSHHQKYKEVKLQYGSNSDLLISDAGLLTSYIVSCMPIRRLRSKSKWSCRPNEHQILSPIVTPPISSYIPPHPCSNRFLARITQDMYKIELF